MLFMWIIKMSIASKFANLRVLRLGQTAYQVLWKDNRSCICREGFLLVYKNIQKQLRVFNSALGQSGFEENWADFWKHLEQSGNLSTYDTYNAFELTTKQLLKSFLVDQ